VGPVTNVPGPLPPVVLAPPAVPASPVVPAPPPSVVLLPPVAPEFLPPVVPAPPTVPERPPVPFRNAAGSRLVRAPGSRCCDAAPGSCFCAPASRF